MTVGDNHPPFSAAFSNIHTICLDDVIMIAHQWLSGVLNQYGCLYKCLAPCEVMTSGPISEIYVVH